MRRPTTFLWPLECSERTPSCYSRLDACSLSWSCTQGVSWQLLEYQVVTKIRCTGKQARSLEKLYGSNDKGTVGRVRNIIWLQKNEKEVPGALIWIFNKKGTKTKKLSHSQPKSCKSRPAFFTKEVEGSFFGNFCIRSHNGLFLWGKVIKSNDAKLAILNFFQLFKGGRKFLAQMFCKKLQLTRSNIVLGFHLSPTLAHVSRSKTRTRAAASSPIIDCATNIILAKRKSLALLKMLCFCGLYSKWATGLKPRANRRCLKRIRDLIVPSLVAFILLYY